MNNVLVVGSNGFIGQNICRKLTEQGMQVYAADIAQSSKHNFFHTYKEFNVVKDSFESLVNEVDCVIYLVSTLLPQPSNLHVLRDVQENLAPVINLLDCVSRSLRCNKVIFASSGGTIYGIHEEKISEDSFLDPKCSYGIMKLTVEKYLSLYSELYGIQTVSLRLSNPYGVGQDFNRPQGAVGVFLHKMLENQPIEIWGDGSVVRDYVYIDDVANAFVSAIKYQGKSDVFNIGMGMGTSLNQLLDLLFEITGSMSVVSYTESRTVDVPSNILDISKASVGLSWSPSIELKSGLTKLFNLIKSTG